MKKFCFLFVMVCNISCVFAAMQKASEQNKDSWPVLCNRFTCTIDSMRKLFPAKMHTKMHRLQAQKINDETKTPAALVEAFDSLEYCLKLFDQRWEIDNSDNKGKWYGRWYKRDRNLLDPKVFRVGLTILETFIAAETKKRQEELASLSVLERYLKQCLA